MLSVAETAFSDQDSASCDRPDYHPSQSSVFPEKNVTIPLEKGCHESCLSCSSFEPIHIQRSSFTSKAPKAYPRPGAKRDQALSIVHHVSCVFHLHFCRLGERKLEHKNRSQACCMTLELMENRKSTNKCGR